MRYEEVKGLLPGQFKRLTGLKRETFERMLEALRQREQQKKRSGRPSKLSLADQLLRFSQQLPPDAVEGTGLTPLTQPVIDGAVGDVVLAFENNFIPHALNLPRFERQPVKPRQSVRGKRWRSGGRLQRSSSSRRFG
jgi:hypothetical protein